MPSRTSLSAKERTLYSKLRFLLTQPGLLRGTLVEMHRRCGKPRCRCADDPAGRHRSLYLGLSLNGQHRMVYIPAAWEARAREWATRYAQVRDLLERISRQHLARLARREE